MFAAPPNGGLYADAFKVTSPRFHSASPSSSCIPMLAGGVAKTRTSIYEVSFPLEKTEGNKGFASLIVFSFYFSYSFCGTGSEE